MAKGRKKKPVENVKKLRSVYATDNEWSVISDKARAEKMDASPYVVQKALN